MVGAGGTGVKYSINFKAASSQSITVPYNSALDHFSAMTFSCWIYSTGVALGTFASKGWAGLGSFLFQINSAGGLGWNIISNANVSYSVGGTTINNQWNHIALVYDGSNLFSYVNGVLSSGPNPAAAGTLTNGAALSLGNFTGNLADIRIYNTSLTASNISALAIGGDVTSGEVARFPFPEGSGTTSTDSINGLVGTFNNGPTWATNIPTQLLPPTQYKWNYTVQTSARGINAISDYITINADNGWQAGPKDDQYYTLGAFFGYYEGMIDPTSVLLELNLMFQTTGGLPTITFQALYNGTPQHTFATQVAVGHTYVRQITVNPPVGTGSTGGDSANPQSTATWTLIDTTGRAEDFTLSIPSSSRFNGLTYDGITWWTFAPAPTSAPLEYDVSITNYGYSFDFGDTYNQFTGSDISVLTDGRYAANSLIYPIGSFHMIAPGQQPKIGMLRT